MYVLTAKIKEVLAAVLPVTVLVLILHFTLTPLQLPLLIRFLMGAALIILGLSIFLWGVDIGISSIGQTMGSSIAKSNRLWVVILAGLLLGFFICIAEPDLHILAAQVNMVTSGLISKAFLVIIVSVGVAVLISLGLVRIVYNISLQRLFLAIYAFIFALALFTSPEFLAIAFDASGATTGAMTVPFILALAMGVSSLKKDSKASENDSFGLVGMASAGAIIAVMLVSVVTKSDQLTGNLEMTESATTSIIEPFIKGIPTISGEVFMALLPIVATFLLFQKFSFKLSKKSFRKIVIGILFTFTGLVLFLLGVNAGFMDVGSTVGFSIASLDNKAYVVIVGFVLGLVVVLAEPAVYVLTHQIEDVTSGFVKRKVVLIALSLGVAVAVALSMLRIQVPGIQLWHFLLPGYLASILMTFFVPPLFIGIAFDAGGVALGPMTATFILAFAHGVAEATAGADVLVDGFGMIAMVALAPLITLQVLGFIFEVKSKKGGLKQYES